MILRSFYVLIALALVLSVYVWEQNQALRLGYRVDSLRRQCETWEQENTGCELRIGSLLAMERLDKVARERKFVSPAENAIVYLQD